MQTFARVILALLLAVFISFPLLAQSAADAKCELPQPSFATNSANIFNDRQEQDLGDALAEMTESDLTLAAPVENDQLTRIGKKLLATLPPSGIKFTFRIYESGELNAFSLAGGHVYVSRKLITAIDNEDELAGVIAHEIGHIITHQTAIEFTRSFRVRLGVTQVGDRADIFAKVHQYFNTPPKNNEENLGEIKDELAADQVALYAMTRAGYAPSSFPSFFNKVTVNKGKTGNWLSDFLGATGENSRRYAAAMKLVKELPPACRTSKVATSEAFNTWRHNMIQERVHNVANGLNDETQIKLDPPLRPSLTHLRFSPDGHFILAQDEGSITVVDKDAEKVLFRADAPDAYPALFTPDSKTLTFYDPKLRIEKWSMATSKRTDVKELVIYEGCQQSMLSADSRTLICINLEAHSDSLRVGVRLIDVEGGKPFFEKKNFYEPSAFSVYGNYLLAIEELTGSDIASVVISPDDHYLVVASGSQSMAYDLFKRELIHMGGKLKDLYQTRMAFVGGNQLFIVGEKDDKKPGVNKALVLSFPDGRLVKEFGINNQGVISVTKGNYLVAGPLKDYAVALLDPSQERFLIASKLPSLDVWENSATTEDANGGIAIGQIGQAGSKHINIPIGPLPSPRSVSISPDGKYLAVSMRNRAEFWNIETGQKIAMTRPFYSSWFNEKGEFYGNFPKFMDQSPVSMKMLMAPLTAHALNAKPQADKADANKSAGDKPKAPGDSAQQKDDPKQKPEDIPQKKDDPAIKKAEDDKKDKDDNGFQYHDMALTYTPLGKGKRTNTHAKMDVKRMDTQKVAWSRDFQHETPAIWPAEDNRMVFAWDLTADAVKDEIKSNPVIANEFENFKKNKKGLLLEIVDPETGRALQQVIIPEADLTHGYDDVRRARISGDFVLAHGEHDNTVIYRISDASKVGEFFGYPIATDAGAGVIAASNREGEIIFVDEHSGKELKRFMLGSPILAARIITNHAKFLLVLTADQILHRIPLDASQTPASTTAANTTEEKSTAPQPIDQPKTAIGH